MLEKICNADGFMDFVKFLGERVSQSFVMSEGLSEFVFERMDNFRPVPDGICPKEWHAMNLNQKIDWRDRSFYVSRLNPVAIGQKRIYATFDAYFADDSEQLTWDSVGLWLCRVGIPQSLVNEEQKKFSEKQYLGRYPYGKVQVRLHPEAFRHGGISLGADVLYIYERELRS